jgi:hypothetical protein
MVEAVPAVSAERIAIDLHYPHPCVTASPLSLEETREDALLTMRDHTTGTLVFRSRSISSGREPDSRLCM